MAVNPDDLLKFDPADGPMIDALEKQIDAFLKRHSRQALEPIGIEMTLKTALTPAQEMELRRRFKAAGWGLYQSTVDVKQDPVRPYLRIRPSR